MESYCEIWEGLFGIGSWHKKYAKLKYDQIIYIYDKKEGEIEKKIHLGISNINFKTQSEEMEIHNGVTEIKMRFKQSALKKNWEIKINEIVD